MYGRCAKLYQRPRDVRFPVVNMDEQPLQLLAEKRRSLPMASYSCRFPCSICVTAFGVHVYGSPARVAYVQSQQWIGQSESKVILDEAYPDAASLLTVISSIRTSMRPCIPHSSPRHRVAESSASTPVSWESVEYSRLLSRFQASVLWHLGYPM